MNMDCLLIDVLVCVFYPEVILELGEVRSFISACTGKPSGGREERMWSGHLRGILCFMQWCPSTAQLLLSYCVCGSEAEQTPDVWACLVQPDAFTAALWLLKCLKMVNWKGSISHVSWVRYAIQKVRKHSGFVCGDRFPKHSAFALQHIPHVVWGLGYRAHALGDGGCALGAPLVWEQLNSDPPLLLWVQPWEREYITPIIGSDLKGSQAVPHVNLWG